MGRHVDWLFETVKAGRIIGDDVIAAMAKQAIALDQAEAGGTRQVAASVPAGDGDDGGLYGRFLSLTRPWTADEYERRAVERDGRLAASARLYEDATDDEVVRAIFDPGEGPE
jgi:hypothetical protein